MHIYSSLEAAQKAGFVWDEYCPEYKLHIVVRSRDRGDGMRVRERAFARPTADVPIPV